MAELKTKKNKASVTKFLSEVDDTERQKDAKILLKLMKEATGEKPIMWGDSMIGFGEYHYKSDRSSQEGDWPMTAFSPRKQNLTVYIMPGVKNYPKELAKLGKFTTGSSCLYMKKLSDVDQKVLKDLIVKGYRDMKKKYG